MSPRKSKASAAEVQEQPSRNVDGAKRAVLDKALGDILKRYGDGSITVSYTHLTLPTILRV